MSDQALDTCFKIEKSWFSYDQKEAVLYIDELNIEKGKLYFIVGRSGVGKSTLLEALGMMNDTVMAKSEKLNFHNSKGDVQTLISIFSDKKLLTKIRSDQYSFIFQDTNLMPNLTSGENMMLSTLVSGKDPDEVAREIKRLLPRFSLPAEVFDKKVQYLSGGQRQRLAFIRAFVSEFSVLFGDEPTGNLDPVTARKIMKILKQEIRSQHKTGVIVSHDIHLAIELADAIIYIKPSCDKLTGKEQGYISEEQVFHYTDDTWSKGNLHFDHGEAYAYLTKKLS